MPAITPNDIAELTDLFFAAAYDDREWTRAASKLKSVLNGSSAAVGLVDLSTAEHILLHGECDAPFDQQFMDPELQNPVLPVMMRSGVGTVVSDYGLVPGEEFRRSIFYNEWLVPQGEQGMLSVKTLSNGRLIAMIGVNRGLRQQAIDDEDVALLRRLTPMLTRISTMRADLGALRLNERGSTYDRLSVGIAIVDAGGKVLHINDEAERLFVDAGSGIGVTHGTLQAGRATPALRRLIHDALQEPDDVVGLGGHLGLSDGARGLALTVAPMRDAAMYGLPLLRAAIVFIQEMGGPAPRGFEARVAALFGMTPREAELAAMLVAGSTMQEVAEQQGISIATARSHLSQLFRKTDTSKQGQLVALLRGILPLGN